MRRHSSLRMAVVWAIWFSSFIVGTTEAQPPYSWTYLGLSDKDVTVITLKPDDPSTLYAGTFYQGVFKSTNGGQDWDEVIIDPPYHSDFSIVFDYSNPSTIFVLAFSYLFKSIDSGVSWSEIPHENSNTLVMDPQLPTTLYLGAMDGVLKSTNGGSSWLHIGLAGSDVSVLAVDPIDTSTFYAGTPWDGVFKSTDGGATWSAINVGLTNLHINALAIDPSSPSNIYAGTAGGGVFFSGDSGMTWHARNSGLTDLHVPWGADLLVDPNSPSKIYVATDDDGVFMSRNGGESWSAINEGLPDLGIWALTIDPGPRSTLYAGIRGEGIFQLLAEATGLDKSTLSFNGTTDRQWLTGPQTIRVNTVSTATVSWTVSTDQSWLQVSPTRGTGQGSFEVTVDSTSFPLLTSWDGTITVTSTVSSLRVANSPRTVSVSGKTYDTGSTRAPFGVFDTPVDGTTGVAGAVAVTGWALDDIEVTGVQIWRSPVSGEGSSLVFIGDTVFVEGSRPDVEAAYPVRPLNYRAGWGYMMLTNFLPSKGNGTFTLYAIATDKEGNQTSLGSKTITCDNANGILPFGTIDTPTQGGTTSGTYRSWGWALTPQSTSIPADGSTISVWVDGVQVGNVGPGFVRGDITTLFSGYDTTTAVHYLDFDTTAYENGVHTIHGS